MKAISLFLAAALMMVINEGILVVKLIRL